MTDIFHKFHQLVDGLICGAVSSGEMKVHGVNLPPHSKYYIPSGGIGIYEWKTGSVSCYCEMKKPSLSLSALSFQESLANLTVLI